MKKTTTKPDSIRAKKKAAVSVTRRLTHLENRMDTVEKVVVARLDAFQNQVLFRLTAVARDSAHSRWVTVIIGLSIALILLGRMYGILGN